jgi:predicted metal-dependent RNase
MCDSSTETCRTCDPSNLYHMWTVQQQKHVARVIHTICTARADQASCTTCDISRMTMTSAGHIVGSQVGRFFQNLLKL